MQILTTIEINGKIIPAFDRNRSSPPRDLIPFKAFQMAEMLIYHRWVSSKWHFYKDLLHSNEKNFYCTLTSSIMQTHSGRKDGHFFILDSYDKPLKYASGTLGLVGLE